MFEFLINQRGTQLVVEMSRHRQPRFFPIPSKQMNAFFHFQVILHCSLALPHRCLMTTLALQHSINLLVIWPQPVLANLNMQ